MAAAAVAYRDEEYMELLGFLTDAKTEVQRFAAEGVLEQTDNQAFVEFCKLHPRKVAKPLLRLAEKAEAESATNSAAASVVADKAKTPTEQKAARMAAMEAVLASGAGSAALQALVNISGIPSVRDELVELSAPRRVAEAMRGGWLEGRSGLSHWHAMLLANITTGQAGQDALCVDEHVLRFLVAAFTCKPRPPARDGYEDPLICLGRVLGNVCANEKGRRILATGSQAEATIAAFAIELADRSRRSVMVNALRNICLDAECHPAVTVSSLFPTLASFLFPWDSASEDLRAQLPEELRNRLKTDGAAMTGDATVRNGAAFCLLGLCRTSSGRDYLRPQGAAALIQAWMQQESEEEIRNALEVCLPSLAEDVNEPAPAQTQDDAANPVEKKEATAEQEVEDEPLTEYRLPTVKAGPLPSRDEGGNDDFAGLFDHIEGVEN